MVLRFCSVKELGFNNGVIVFLDFFSCFVSELVECFELVNSFVICIVWFVKSFYIIIAMKST